MLFSNPDIWSDFGESTDPMRKFHEHRLLRVKAGKEVYDLSMLNPDLPPPRFLVDKLVEASLRPQSHRYASSRGIRKLREAFSEKYRDAFKASINPESEVVVTCGTKDAIFHGLPFMAAPGSKVLVGAPTYPAFLAALKLHNLEACFFNVSCDEQTTFASLEESFAMHNPALLLLNFPHNPSGLTVSAEFYDQLAKLLEGSNALVLNDFVYGEMCFGVQAAVSLLACEALRSRALETYSLSKAYSVPGWRVGALLGKSEVVARLARLKSHIDYGLFLPHQSAAAAALASKLDLRASIVRTYQERTRFLARGLNALGWEAAAPKAGATIWARMPAEMLRIIEKDLGKTPDSFQAALWLLDNLGVVAMPGKTYGAEFDNYLRYACVAATETLREVLSQLSGVCLGAASQAEDKEQVDIASL